LSWTLACLMPGRKKVKCAIVQRGPEKGKKKWKLKGRTG